MFKRRRSFSALYLLVSTEILICGQSIAASTWTLNQSTEKVDFYLNIKTLKKSDQAASIWVMSDYKRPQILVDKTYNSTKHLEEYDCQKDRMRYVTNFFYTRKLGKGEVIYVNHEPTDWTYIPPESSLSQILNLVCSN